MAKKAQKPGHESNGISKAQAVRNAMAEGLESLDDIEGFLKSRHGIEMPRQQLSAYKSQAKARESAGNETAPKAAAKPTSGNDGDLLDALEAIKPLVEKLGAEKVRRLVDLLS